MNCCINGGYFIKLLHVSIKLFKFEIQNCGQILCAHKPYFLMPGHIWCIDCKLLSTLFFTVAMMLLRYSSGGGRRDSGYIDYDREDYLGHSNYVL